MILYGAQIKIHGNFTLKTLQCLDWIKHYPWIFSQLLFLLEKAVKDPGMLSLPFSQVEQLLDRLGMLTWNVLLLPSWVPSSWFRACIFQWFPWC